MKLDNIEELLQKYYEGETTVAEEKELQAFFTETADLPEHLKAHAAPFQYYAKQQQQQSIRVLSDDWLFEKIAQEEVKQPEGPKGRQVFFPILQEYATYWRVAAGIIFILGAFWLGRSYNQGIAPAQDAEIAALREEVEEMKLAMTTGASASERIQLVSQEFDTEQPDEIIQVLITTMNQDPNVNVRVAASEALYKFSHKKVVRQALAESLKLQTDPIMQLTLIDMLVNIKEKEAVGELEEMANRKDLLPIVKSKAAEGLGILI
ncbi:HEAT repeat domain-containing protein [Pontibacter sp. BT731]|uniref:HEAT repeat domain-containing protein n=1 Tax=Pontibacter coccineus TaxID=3063328 RepID=UPI0026E2ADF4|nr:HEAT repeat domain-containing protein [Pontibacter sp. BT731]MDO6390862.1 HEAT repeat domain-containing protein [Pontibacter sp. BT731]